MIVQSKQIILSWICVADRCPPTVWRVGCLRAKFYNVIGLFSNMFTEIIAAVVGAGVSQGFGYGVWQYKKKTEDVNQWYEDVISSISYGLCICQSARERSNLKYGDIAEESQKVSQRLKDHLNPHPKQIDEESIRHVKNLEKLFRKVSAASEATDEQSVLDSIEELFEMGQREYKSNTDVNMAEALNASTDHSTTMAGLFDKTGRDPQGFGVELGKQFENANSFQELLQAMNSEHGTNQRSVERMLEAQFITDEWDKSLSVGIRILLQMTSNLCKEAINTLSEANNMNTAN